MMLRACWPDAADISPLLHGVQVERSVRGPDLARMLELRRQSTGKPANVFRAGCDSPPAVGVASLGMPTSPRALPAPSGGQQIRSNAGADGHSPDERRQSRAALGCVLPHALWRFSLVSFHAGNVPCPQHCTPSRLAPCCGDRTDVHRHHRRRRPTGYS